MALSNSQYQSIMRVYEDKQTKNRHALEARTAQVMAQIDGYRELSESIASVSVAQGKKMLEGDEHAFAELKGELCRLSGQKKKLLMDAGFPEDYLSPIYDCPDCHDTGYIGNQKCHCFKQAIINMLYEQSGIQKMLEEENFSSLSYDYYQGQDLERFKRNVSIAQNFVKTFNSDYHNLFFYGTVGTGKSFLSGCIAKELIEKEYSVIYFSASGLFNSLSRSMFDYKNISTEFRNLHKDLYDCHLLIIDDLGTEYVNNATTSMLFSLLNERHLSKKATIISTNLFLEDIQKIYSERIFSRIMNQYTICRFSGPDIRISKITSK